MNKSARRNIIGDALFYLGLALLFTHELDAMPNHEWRLLPILQSLPDSAGETTFIVAHIPIFAIIVACIASLNAKTRSVARSLVSGLLVLHAILHLLFAAHDAYEFDSMYSSLLIHGAALCGAIYLLFFWLEARQSRPY